MAVIGERATRHIIRIFIVANVVVLFLACIVIHRKGGLDWLMYQFSGGQAVAYSHTKESVYDCIPITSNDIVMLGDSMLDYGEWHELLDTPLAKNRAISGDCLHDVIVRVAPIVDARPACIVVMAGINDLQRGESVEQVMAEYTQLVDMIRQGSPGTRLALLPILAPNERLYRAHIKPRFPGIHMPTAAEVAEINAHIEGLGEVVDLSCLLENGQIAPDYTLDGLHLNGSGLQMLAQVLRARLDAIVRDELTSL